MTGSTDRLRILDSYRALAALYVVGFHYFHRWTNLPVGEQLIPTTPILSSSSVIAHGYLGVEFFFIISGFVIAMTLNHTHSFLDFAAKRFARLFPAMFVCALLTFVVVNLLGVAPFSNVSMLDFIPSLTFISPQIINKLFGLETNWISGVYWSLFVEVKFYIYAALIYFVNPRRFLVSFFLLTSVICAVFWFAMNTEQSAIGGILNLVFFPRYAFLFVAGMAFQSIHSNNRKPTFGSVAIIFCSLAYSLLVYSPLNPLQPSSSSAMLPILTFFVLFALFVADAKVLTLLDSKALAKIGAASYSLYLLHESIGVSAIYQLNEKFFPSKIWLFGVAVAVLFVSIFIYDHFETPARRFIRGKYASLSRRVR